MIDLGIVRPGSTIRIPFSTFKGSDGSSLTMTNFTTADILIYKDGSGTERASTAGFTATTDFDGKTGKQLLVIDLADNTTAGFYASGSEYLVAVDAVTVDAVTTGAWVARFQIGAIGAFLNTTIATLATQTSFTLTSGPAEDNALVGMWAIIYDVASAVQQAKVLISAYTGSTKTVTLVAGATFTVAASDNFCVMGVAPLQPTTLGNTLDVSSGGEAGIDWANIGSKTTTNALTGTTIATTQQVDLNTIKTQSVTCSGGVTVPAATLASTTNITAGTLTTVTNLTNLPAITTGWITALGIADGAIDSATFAAGTTIPRCTLVDTTTTNTDMRGTDNAALALTALSTAQWTNSLATSLGTLAGHDPGEVLAGRTNITAASGISLASNQHVIVDSGMVDANLVSIDGYGVAVDTGTVGVISFVSNAYVATQGGTVQANIVQVDGEDVEHDGFGRLRVDIAKVYNDAPAAESLFQFIDGGFNVGDVQGNVTGNVGGDVLGVVKHLENGIISTTTFAAGAINANAIGTNAITATKIATDAVGAAQLAADAVAEIQSGLSTYAGGDTSGTTTLLSRLSDTRAGYLDNLSGGAVALASGVTVMTNNDKTGYSLSGTLTTLDAFNTSLSSVHGAGSWATATGFSTLTASDVWANATRTLSAFGFTVDTNANSTETAIKAKTDLIPSSPAATGDAMTLTSGERNSVASALLNLTDGVEVGITVQEALRYIASSVVAVLSGAGGTGAATITIKAIGNDGTTRLTVETDEDGNRTSVTLS